MRKRYAALLLGAALGLSLLNGCKGENKNTKDPSELSREAENAMEIYGEVSQVTEHGITIKVGTRKEGRASQQEGSSRGGMEEMPSMLDLTGEEEEIEVTGETVIKRQVMRGGPGGRDGNEEPPEMPESDPSSGERPDGEMPKGGKPDGEMPSEEQLDGEQPSGDFSKRGNLGEEITLSDISQGDTVAVVLAQDNSAEKITVLSGAVPGGRNQDSQPEEDKTVKNYTGDVQVDGETITSKKADENGGSIAVQGTDGTSYRAG